MHLAEASMAKPKALSFVFSGPEHRSSLSPTDVCEVDMLPVTPHDITTLQMEDRSGRRGLQVWLLAEVRTKGGLEYPVSSYSRSTTVQKKSGEQVGSKPLECSLILWPYVLFPRKLKSIIIIN